MLTASKKEEDIKNELIIDSQSSVKKIKEELPLNNTANSAPASLVVLDWFLYCTYIYREFDINYEMVPWTRSTSFPI